MASATDSEVRERLIEELLDRLETRGVPQGTWLVEIGQAREALRSADALLRRLEDALIRKAGAP